MGKQTITFPPLKDLINDRFIELWNNNDRYLIIYGGRGSSKSVFNCKRMIFKCLNDPYFRCILIRNVAEAVKDSIYQTIKDIVEELGLGQFFKFTINPLEIRCINGNKFLCRGLDDTTKIKSIKDPTHAVYEEDIPTREDFLNITGCIRTDKAKYLQEIFTINPECDGHYEDNWFWQLFFKPNEGELSFRNHITIKVDGEDLTLPYTVHHSTYKDNRWLPKATGALYESYRTIDPYKFKVHTLGEWGAREVGARFWKGFDMTRHVGKCELNCSLPVHVSFDENTRPYPAVSIWQYEEVGLITEIRQIFEIALRTPRNKLIYVASDLRDYLRRNGFNGIVYLYGDSTSKREDAKQAQGVNYFTIFQNEIVKNFECRICYMNLNPNIKMSAEFINHIYSHGFGGLNITIDITIGKLCSCY